MLSCSTVGTSEIESNYSISGSTVIPLSNTAVYDPASIANGSSISTGITVTGAAVGDFVKVSFSNDLAGVALTAYVSGANTVTVLFANNTGSAVDLASGTIKVVVSKR